MESRSRCRRARRRGARRRVVRERNSAPKRLGVGPEVSRQRHRDGRGQRRQGPRDSVRERADLPLAAARKLQAVFQRTVSVSRAGVANAVINNLSKNPTHGGRGGNGGHGSFLKGMKGRSLSAIISHPRSFRGLRYPPCPPCVGFSTIAPHRGQQVWP